MSEAKFWSSKAFVLLCLDLPRLSVLFNRIIIQSYLVFDVENRVNRGSLASNQSGIRRGNLSNGLIKDTVQPLTQLIVLSEVAESSAHQVVLVFW